MSRPFAAPAALALLGASLVHGCSEPPTVTYTQPQREDLVSHVITNGEVHAGERADVFAETTGRVVEVAVEEGRRLRRSDPLLTVDDRAAREERKQAEAQLEGARAELDGIQQGGSPAEIAEIENGLASAKRSKEQLEQDVHSLERLVEKQAAPRAELDASRRQLKRTEGEIDLLEKKLAVRFAPHHKQAAEARVREAQAAVALATQKVGSATVVAPLDGVVYSLAVRQGAYVNPGTLVARVGTLSPVEVMIYVDEPELGRVKLGTLARITTDAYPEKHWECRIERLPAEIVALETRRVGEVRCTLGDSGELIPNLRVSVEIASESAPNALTLPREAVFRDGRQAWVWVVNESGQAERKDVESGIASANRMEIRSGLSESDRVLLPGQQALTAGQTVRPAEVREAAR